MGKVKKKSFFRGMSNQTDCVSIPNGKGKETVMMKFDLQEQ